MKCSVFRFCAYAARYTNVRGFTTLRTNREKAEDEHKSRSNNKSAFASTTDSEDALGDGAGPAATSEDQFTTEEIMQMQIDALRHVAVVDEVWWARFSCLHLH